MLSLSTSTVHPIEQQSYAIVRQLAGTSGLPPFTRAVVERVVHATADPGYVHDLVCEEEMLARGAAALAAGAPIVTDVAMVAAGITARDVVCRVSDPRAEQLAAAGRGLTRSAVTQGLTRSAAGVRVALEDAGPGAVWVIGCAPTALEELLVLAGSAQPALVIGVPVGFVGAAEAKATLRSSRLPSVTNVSAKGGSAVAAAAVNALLYTELYAESYGQLHTEPSA